MALPSKFGACSCTLTFITGEKAEKKINFRIIIMIIFGKILKINLCI